MFSAPRSTRSRRASSSNPPPSAAARKDWRWLKISVVVIILAAAFFYVTSAKTLGEPIEMNYGAAEPAFQDSLGSLLGQSFVGGNKVSTLVNGVQVFPAMVEAIRRAQYSITLETYIWESGRVSDRFMAALVERARHGVKVHALVDGAGSLKLDDAEVNQLKAAGVEFVVYKREHWWQLKLDLNHRTHRKLLVVDGQVGFTGGVCIADSWYGDAESMKVWRDTQYRVEGPAARQMQAIFAQNWLETTGRLLQGPHYFPGTQNRGEVLVQSWESGPREGPEKARMAYLLAIASARTSIKLMHAYFVPDDLAIEMLLAARRRGVQIEVIVPLKNDSRIGRGAARSRWGRLLEAGVVIWQYRPALYHCKAMIVDDIFVTVGSVNFDNRSFGINDEANINVLDRDFAREQLRIFDEDRNDSVPLTLDEFRNRSVWVKLTDQLSGLVRSQL